MLSNHGMYYFLYKSLLLNLDELPHLQTHHLRQDRWCLCRAEAELLVRSNGSREDAQGNNFVIFIVFHCDCEHDYPGSNKFWLQ